MKKIILLIALILITTVNAQAPQGFNYQATVRNSTGALIVNQNVNFKFNIMLNSQTSVPIFSETHYVPTDDLGQVNLVIGTGTATTGAFSSINWGNGTYYLGIELNTGSGYVAMGTTQLLSVPYALYANSAGSANTSTMIVSPTVTTAPVGNLTMFDATLTATIANVNLNQINEKGFAYSINPNPRRTEGEYNVIVSDPFEYSINDLDTSFLPNTTYYVRAYVVTENEVVVYGNQVSFTTLSLYQNGNGLTDVEGNQYPSIILNGQEWMQNNLSVTKYRNGDIIPEVTDETEWANLTTGAWRYIANDPAYGKLYNWYAVNDPRGLAPQGWHVATASEFIGLTNFLGGSNVAGARIKGGHWGWDVIPVFLNNCSISHVQFNNISGFNALGGNHISEIGQYQCAYQCTEPPYICGYVNGIPFYCGGGYVCSPTGSAGFWWSATSVDSTTANNIIITIESDGVTDTSSNKKNGYSVRCVKN